MMMKETHLIIAIPFSLLYSEYIIFKYTKPGSEFKLTLID